MISRCVPVYSGRTFFYDVEPLASGYIEHAFIQNREFGILCCLCAYFCIEMTAKQIAQILNISPEADDLDDVIRNV